MPGKTVFILKPSPGLAGRLEPCSSPHWHYWGYFWQPRNQSNTDLCLPVAELINPTTHTSPWLCQAEHPANQQLCYISSAAQTQDSTAVPIRSIKCHRKLSLTLIRHQGDKNTLDLCLTGLTHSSCNCRKSMTALIISVTEAWIRKPSRILQTSDHLDSSTSRSPKLVFQYHS